MHENVKKKKTILSYCLLFEYCSKKELKKSQQFHHLCQYYNLYASFNLIVSWNNLFKGKYKNIRSTVSCCFFLSMKDTLTHEKQQKKLLASTRTEMHLANNKKSTHT